MEHREPDDRELDRKLRRLLEPNPLRVERLVRTALAEEPARRAPGRVWPRLAVAAALVVLALLAIPKKVITPPSVTPVAPEARYAMPAHTAVEPSETRPVRISISNADGYVTISSAAGPQWIVLSGDES